MERTNPSGVVKQVSTWLLAGAAGVLLYERAAEGRVAMLAVVTIGLAGLIVAAGMAKNEEEDRRRRTYRIQQEPGPVAVVVLWALLHDIRREFDRSKARYRALPPLPWMRRWWWPQPQVSVEDLDRVINIREQRGTNSSGLNSFRKQVLHLNRLVDRIEWGHETHLSTLSFAAGLTLMKGIEVLRDLSLEGVVIPAALDAFEEETKRMFPDLLAPATDPVNAGVE